MFLRIFSCVNVHFCSFLQSAHKIDNLSIGEEDEDGSDVLIECRDVYKSFGEKHILRGVSFKVIFVFMLIIYLNILLIKYINNPMYLCFFSTVVFQINRREDML